MSQATARAEDRRNGHTVSLIAGLATVGGNLDVALGALQMLVAIVMHEHREFKGQQAN